MMTFLYNAKRRVISEIRRLLAVDIRWEFHRRFFRAKPIIVSLPEYKCKLALYIGEHVSEAIRYGSFEVDVCNYVRRFLRPGMTFFDIGANLGLYTIIAGNILRENGKVHSFEPSQREFKRLKRNVSLNRLSNVVLNRMAVLDRETEVKLSVCDDARAAYNSLCAITHPGAINSFIRQETVQSTTIDAYLQQNDVKRVNLIKMDIEGAEILALRGGANLLKQRHSPVVIFECAECAIQRDGEGQRQFGRIRDLFSEYGYILYEFVSDEGILQPVIEKPLSKRWNFVAIRPSYSKNMGQEMSDEQ